MSVIRFSLTDDRHSIWPNLEQDELAAIGAIMVQWSIFEHLLLERTKETCEALNIPLLEHASSLSFKKRLRAYRALIDRHAEEGEIKKRILDTLTCVGSLERSRNRITHGLWDYDPATPWRLKAGSNRIPFDFEEPFDVAKLMRVAEMIAECNFRFMFLGGKDEAYSALAASYAEDGGFVSRSLLLELTKEHPANPRRPRPKRPKGTPHQEK